MRRRLIDNKETVIVYGGTFDPPHKGHVALIKAAIRQKKPEHFYIVPSFQSPFKDLPASSFKDRVSMIKAGIKDLRNAAGICIHGFEHDRGRLTYTWQATDFFSKKHPNAEIYLLMGSDCLEAFHLWKKYRKILVKARLLVGARDGFKWNNPRGLPVERLKGIFPLVSSSGLKVGLLSGGNEPDIPPAVAEVIAKKGLYMDWLRKRVSRLLGPARYRHVRSVTKLAVELALKYGINAERAAAAALLHDVARELPLPELKKKAAISRDRPRDISWIIEKAPILLHSYISADIAESKFNIKDRSILRAIREHTIGSLNPDMLSKILYVADLAAYDRTFPEARFAAGLAFVDLDAAYLVVNYVKLLYSLRSKSGPHPESVRIWNHLLKKSS